MKKADQIIGVIVLIFSGFVIAESFRIPELGGTRSFEPGVKFLPFWLGVLMAGLSILLIVTALSKPTPVEEKRVMPGRQAVRAIALILVGLAAYVSLLEVMGFLVDTTLFNAFLLGVVMRKKWKGALLIALIASGALYVVFQILLEVNLPKNIFGF
jgi:putative tricarboxylic transport membrane protein